VATQINAICQAIAERLGQQRYQIWFKNSTKFTLGQPRPGESAGYLKIGVPNLFIAGWIENHFLDDISQAVLAATGNSLKITFAIDPELSAIPARGVARPPAYAGASLPPQQRGSGDGRRTMEDGRRGRTAKLTFDTFVVGPSNELAYNAAKQVVCEQQSRVPTGQPPTLNPLFIHGGYGLGKTHLLQGVCNEVAKNRPQTNWLYLSAEDFANQFVLALKTKKLETFRHKMRQTDLLAIDDIHFLANKPATQEEFLHTFNTINLAGKQIVLASDAHPKTINQLSEKLINRFISGMVVKIEPPNFQTRCQICRQYASRLSRQNPNVPGYAGPVPESVIRYVAENLRGSVRELEGALVKVVAYSALQNEKITLAMTQAVLAEHLERCDPIVRVSDIESAVATYFGTTAASLHSSKKDRTISLARHFSMYLARKHTKMSSCEIGRFMGNKNHATVLLACQRIEELLKQNADVHWRSPAGNRLAKARVVLTALEESISA
jgi:chromosomal replication initiator protein